MLDSTALPTELQPVAITFLLLLPMLFRQNVFFEMSQRHYRRVFIDRRLKTDLRKNFLPTHRQRQRRRPNERTSDVAR